MEEERRLMYVGITRAKEKVYLLFTRERNIFGSSQANPPSRFLDDIPEYLIEKSHKDRFPEIKINFKERGSVKHFFKDGDRIRHEKFGPGLIIASAGDTLTVAFSKLGLKKISASVAPIKKV
jgi:DNA helicase-2/ATP-dependent DNA helicase PcrA